MWLDMRLVAGALLVMMNDDYTLSRGFYYAESPEGTRKKVYAQAISNAQATANTQVIDSAQAIPSCFVGAIISSTNIFGTEIYSFLPTKKLSNYRML